MTSVDTTTSGARRVGCGSVFQPLLILAAWVVSFAAPSTAWSQTAPTLVSATPADGAMFVAVTNRVVVFTFDQPMKKDPNIAMGPPATPAAVRWFANGVLNPAAFTYSWNDDGTRLICTYSGPFETGTQINWVLNPNSAPVKLESAAGVPLPTGLYRGQFTTAGAGPSCDPDGVPDNYGSFALYKIEIFAQTSADDPVPAAEDNAHSFSAYVYGLAGLTGASLTRSSGVSNSLAGGGVAQIYEVHPTEAALNASVPAGDYVLRLTQSGQPEYVIPMTLPAEFPPVPKILNFEASQHIDPAKDFTLQWNGIPDAGTNDHISMFIGDGKGAILYYAPDACIPRPLPATATSMVIPAGTLKTNGTFNVELLFGRLFYHSTNAVPLMAGFGDLNRRIHFTIKTGDAGTVGATPATLSDARILPNGHPQFTVAGTASSTHGIERATRLLLPDWSEITTVTLSPGGTTVFEDTGVGLVFPLYYRAVAR
jgi:hypothetical protein